MELWNSIDDVPADCGETVLTIGKFDGIHLGHRALIAETIELAKARNAKSALVTFDRHPDEVLHPERNHRPIIGANQKLELVRETGIDALLTLPFDESFAAQSPEEFVRGVLARNLHAKLVVVGEDFRFGVHGSGDVSVLADLGKLLGFEVRVVPPVEIEGQRVSSTGIRDALELGNVELAAAMLGRRHSLTGIVEHGKKIGRQIGFPTANLSRQAEGYLPADGVYAGWLHCDGEKYPAAISVGINDTVVAVPRLAEAHVLDRDDLDLYDKQVTLDFVARIRPAKKFAGLPELIDAINQDISKVRTALSLTN